jgi:hypothetical protein
VSYGAALSGRVHALQDDEDASTFAGSAFRVEALLQMGQPSPERLELGQRRRLAARSLGGRAGVHRHEVDRSGGEAEYAADQVRFHARLVLCTWASCQARRDLAVGVGTSGRHG